MAQEPVMQAAVSETSDTLINTTHVLARIIAAILNAAAVVQDDGEVAAANL